MKTNWVELRDIRLKILEISDDIQSLSLQMREKNEDMPVARKLNDIQIKLGELIGQLMFLQSKEK